MAENYIVSARKYRPQTFDTVVGQEHITTTLKNAIRQQHLAHAYLFCGPRGVGKTTCARILSRTINCETPTPDMEACGTCTTCLSFKDNTSFNVFELDAASNNSVDDIRNLIDQVRFAPQQGRYKVYIIDEVHMLSSSAFNAFLKTLEEPPPYAIFILATTEKHKILPTILSRCQIFDFKRITTTDIVNHLHSIATKEGVIAQEAGLHVIAQKSEGCMRDALSMLDRIVSFTNGMLTYQSTMEHLNLLDADFYFKLTDHILSQDVAGTLLLLDETLEKGFEGDVILEGLAEHFRNLLLCKDQRMAKLLDVPTDHKPVFFEKANQCPPSFILSALNVVNESELSFKNATNKRLHIEMCLIRLCYVLQATDVKKNSDSEGIVSPTAMPYIPQPATNNNKQQQTTTNNNIAETSPPYHAGVGAGAAANPQPEQATTNHNKSQQTTTNHNIQDTPPPSAGAVNQDTVSNPTPAFNPTTTFTPPPPGAKRRISRGLMDLDNLGEITQAAVERKELTIELATEMYNAYTQTLKDAGRDMYHAQLSSMKLEVNPPDEIRIIAPGHFAEEYAKEQRNTLIDFFRKESGNNMIRVMTEVREDPNSQTERVTVLSKPEMLEAMIQQNPNLGQLKDALGLQVEY
jgi:DNA polymerase III subunit gamma/tau